MPMTEQEKAYARHYYKEKIKADPERWATRQQQRREQRIRIRIEHPEIYALRCQIHQQRDRERLAADPSAVERRRDLQLQNKYGMTRAERETLLASQGGCCALCRRPIVFTGRSGRSVAVVDHCHTTGRVRGVLCGSCNLNLGHFNDDPQALRAAALYLERG